MKKQILVFGLIYGIVGLVFSYFMLQGSVGSFKGAGLSILILIVIQIIAVILLKKQQGEVILFTEILLICVGIGIVGLAFSIIGNQIYLALLSPEAKEIIITNLVDVQIDSMESMGMPMQPGEEEDLIKTMEDSMSFKMALINLPIMVLSSAVIGVVLGLIFKKDSEI